MTEFASCVVRPIAPGDWPEIFEIQTASYPPEAIESLDILRCHAAVAPNSCLVACESDSVTGYLLAHPWPARSLPPLRTRFDTLPAHSNSMFLHDVAVHPAARGKKVADRLMQELLHRSHRDGFHHFSLIAVGGAHPFWARRGFVEVPAITHRFSTALEEFFPGGDGRYMERVEPT